MSTATLKNRIENLVATANLLERVDANPALIGAAQYQSLVRKLGGLLVDRDLPADALQALLKASPACAMIYENLNYQHAGLSQAPLEPAAAAELQAAELLGRLRAKGGPKQS